MHIVGIRFVDIREFGALWHLRHNLPRIVGPLAIFLLIRILLLQAPDLDDMKPFFALPNASTKLLPVAESQNVRGLRFLAPEYDGVDTAVWLLGGEVLRVAKACDGRRLPRSHALFDSRENLVGDLFVGVEPPSCWQRRMSQWARFSLTVHPRLHLVHGPLP